MYFRYYVIGNGHGPSFENKIEFPLPRMLCESLVEIGPAVLKKKILNFVVVFSLFINYPPPLEKGVALRFNILESPHSRMFCATFG